MVGGSRENGGRFVFRWPIWKTPISLACIRALLSHPNLESGKRLATLDIIEVRQAHRISVGKFMNITAGIPLGEKS